jgi:hypothetical protein
MIVMAVAFVVVMTFLGLIQVFLRLLLKGSLAAGGAEIIGFPLIFHTPRGLSRINFHTTHRIFCHFLNLLIN